MSLLSIALQQSQLRPQYHPSYSTDPNIHKDDCRKMLDELCDEKRMDKRTVYAPGKRVFYTARPE